MEKTITTSLFIVVSIILILVLFNATYPAIQQGSDAIGNMANGISDQMKTHIAVIHASGELDHTGWWQDTNGNSLFDVFVWLKNTGTTRIAALNQLDVFFGPEGNFARIPDEDEADGAYPYWTPTVEGGGDWVPTTTLQIAVHYQTPLTTGRYFIKVVAPDGVSSEYFVGI